MPIRNDLLKVIGCLLFLLSSEGMKRIVPVKQSKPQTRTGFSLMASTLSLNKKPRITIGMVPIIR